MILIIVSEQLVNWACKANVSANFPFFQEDGWFLVVSQWDLLSQITPVVLQNPAKFPPLICDREGMGKWHFTQTLPEVLPLSSLFLSSFMGSYLWNPSSVTELARRLHRCCQARRYRVSTLGSTLALLAPASVFPLGAAKLFGNSQPHSWVSMTCRRSTRSPIHRCFAEPPPSTHTAPARQLSPETTQGGPAPEVRESFCILLHPSASFCWEAAGGGQQLWTSSDQVGPCTSSMLKPAP